MSGKAARAAAAASSILLALIHLSTGAAATALKEDGLFKGGRQGKGTLAKIKLAPKWRISGACSNNHKYLASSVNSWLTKSLMWCANKKSRT